MDSMHFFTNNISKYWNKGRSKISQNPKISVIMPIYNVEEYLEETLNCLVHQSFIENMEVLMINDGSTDNSRDIMEKYAERYENFHAFNKENEGLAITRNYGIDLAKGDYIHFFDSDDWINLEGYERLYDLALKNNSDVVTAFSMRVYRYNIIDSLLFKRSYKNISEDIDSLDLEEIPEIVWDTVVWNKLFKRSFIEKNNIRFLDEDILYEDAPFALKAYALANNISVSRDNFYFWRIRENKDSITQEPYKMKNFLDRIRILKISNDILNEENFNEDSKDILYFKWLENDLDTHLRCFSQFEEEFHKDIVDYANEILDIIPDHVREQSDSLRQVLFKMVENRDINGLIAFSDSYYDLAKDPLLLNQFGEEYSKCIDLERDIRIKELSVEKEEIYHDDENLFIKFFNKNRIFDNFPPNKIGAMLIDEENKEFPLELNEDGDIILPLDLIEDKNHMHFRIEYIYDNFKKECYLRNLYRGVIRFDEFDIEIGIEPNEVLFIDVRFTNDLELAIENVTFEDDELKFYGEVNEEIDSVFILNVVTLNEIRYSVDCERIENQFKVNFSIPYGDILSFPVKKWELRVGTKFKNVKIINDFEYCLPHHFLSVVNTRNKLLISDDFC